MAVVISKTGRLTIFISRKKIIKRNYVPISSDQQV
jgi:hypothetical protein